MIDDVYQMALGAVRRHLEKARVSYREEDGDLVVGGHRLGLSIAFEGFSRQGDQAIAPLDIQIHFDGDEGDRFRIGTLGVGPTQEEALQSAVDEWHLLAASPLLAALGAEVGSPKRGASPRVLAGWQFFAGRAGLRGTVPTGLHAGGSFLTQLITAICDEVRQWPEPREFTLRSMFIMAGQQDGQHEVQAAVDGFVSQRLTDLLNGLPWPTATEAYFFKQMYVLRHGVAPSR